MHFTKKGYEKVFDELEKTLAAIIGDGIPGNDCVVYHNGEEVFRHTNGFSDAENRIPMNGRERYNMYSCSKIVTCTAALMLYEKKLLALDDYVYKYIPEFKNAVVLKDGKTEPVKNHITIRHLFTMSAGLDYDLSSEYIALAQKETDGKCPTAKMPAYIIRKPLLFEPGTHFEYSLCHDIIAAIVEIITANKYGDFIKSNIFSPLGMSRSTFLASEGEYDDVFPQYRCNDETGLLDNVGNEIQGYKLGSEYESGGAGCISTADDFIKFLEALRCGKLLSGDTLDLMCTPQLSRDADDDFHREFYNKYGYGLGVRCPQNDKDVTDFGWGGAAGQYCVIDRQHNYTLFYGQHVLNTPEIFRKHRESLSRVSKKCIEKYEAVTNDK